MTAAAHTRPVSPSPQREADPQGRPCAETRCPGRRMTSGGLLGLCIACARQKDGAKGSQPARIVRMVWACDQREKGAK